MNNRMCGLAAGAIVFFISTIFGQVSVQPGITAGLNSFTEKMKTSGMTISPGSKMGFVAGGVLDISLLDLISIEPGVLYTTRGSITTITDSGISMTGTDSYSYLTIPIHAKVKYVTPLIKPYALAGLNFGILLDAKWKTEIAGMTPQEENAKDSVSAMDMGLDFGLGVEFSLPAIVPYVEYVYYLGLANIMKNPTDDESVKNDGWEIKAGLRFKL